MDNTIAEKNIDKLTLDKASLSWLKFPSGAQAVMFAVLPLIFAQIIQRIYPIIDNHYINILGSQALLIHNIQYGFICLGQYIGSATAISCLIFWKRSTYADKQKCVFTLHITLCAIATCSAMFAADFYAKDILAYFSVQNEYRNVGAAYFRLGLFNMVLQALYLTLMGVIIASNKERLNLVFSVALLIMNVIADTIAIHVIYSGSSAPTSIFNPLMLVASATTVMLLGAIIILYFLILKKTTGWGILNVKEILKIWLNELGGAFISGVYPIIYIFQLGAVKSNGSLLVTYQLLLQLTLVFCIPLLATMQIALRDASDDSSNTSRAASYKWKQELFYFGLSPTQLLLILFLFMPIFSMNLVFGYVIPSDHVSFIVLFLIASIIGQFGNALTVPLRARKKSHLVTINYFITDIIVMLGGMQLIILLHCANSFTAGLVTLAYASIYTLLNGYFVLRK